MITFRFDLPPNEFVTCFRFTKTIAIEASSGPIPLLIVSVNVTSGNFDSAECHGKIYVFPLDFLFARSHSSSSSSSSSSMNAPVTLQPWWEKVFEGSITTFEPMKNLLVIATIATGQNITGWSRLAMVNVSGKTVLSGVNQTFDLPYYISSISIFKTYILVGSMKMGITFLKWKVCSLN